MLMAIGVASCSDDSGGGSGAFNNVKNTFEKMKGSYTGQMSMPSNQRQEVSFSIDANANVVVTSFPMDNVMAKVYPNDYQRVSYSGDAFTYSCPIDSIGLPADGQLQFVTKEDFESNRVNFSYKLKETEHTGYMLIKTKGIYNSFMNSLTVNFIVTDLVIDNNDYSSVCPIDNYMDIATHQ